MYVEGTGDRATGDAVYARRDWRRRPVDAKTIAFIEDLRHTCGMSLRQIARALDEEGFSTPSEGGAWHPQQVSRILNRTGNIPISYTP